MKLIYYNEQPNVGDDLNRWLWPKIGIFFDNDPEHICLGIGSILIPQFIPKTARKVTVIGTGARSRRTFPDLSGREWDFRFVRGPRTAKLSGSKYISDPAILAPRFMPISKERYGIGFVPHFQTDEETVTSISDLLGARIIRPHLSPQDFICEIASCERVVCEAMHGAILADAYRVPWTPVRLGTPIVEGRANRFKWSDWLSSLGIRQSMPRFPLWAFAPSVVRERFGRMQGVDVNTLKFGLSDENILQDAQDQILEACRVFMRDASGGR